jgi:peroxiredoxin
MKKAIALLFSFVFLVQISNAQYAIGDKATDFKLKNIDGKMVSLADFTDAKGFIVVFTCNHCPWAVLYEDRVEALNKEFASKGYPVIGINPNDPVSYPEDNFDNMKKRAAEKGFTFPYLVDETSDLAKTYGATKTPHVFVLKKENGAYIVKYIGTIDDNPKDATKVEKRYLANAVNDLLAGKIPQVAETKAIGCSIKFRGAVSE